MQRNFLIYEVGPAPEYGRIVRADKVFEGKDEAECWARADEFQRNNFPEAVVAGYFTDQQTADILNKTTLKK